MPQRLHNPSGALAILFSISDDSCNKGLADLKIAAGATPCIATNHTLVPGTTLVLFPGLL